MSGGMENLLTGAVVKGLYPVCDYWQLVTDAPIVTIYNPFRVLEGGRALPPPEYGRLCGRRITAEEYLEEAYYRLTLEHGAELCVSLRPRDYTCPEGVYLFNSNEGLFVVF